MFHARVLLFIGDDARDGLDVTPVLADFAISFVRTIRDLIILLLLIHLF